MAISTILLALVALQVSGFAGLLIAITSYIMLIVTIAVILTYRYEIATGRLFRSACQRVAVASHKQRPGGLTPQTLYITSGFHWLMGVTVMDSDDWFSDTDALISWAAYHRYDELVTLVQLQRKNDVTSYAKQLANGIIDVYRAYKHHNP